MAVHKFSVPSEVDQFKSVTLECDDEVRTYNRVVLGKCHLTLLSGETVVLSVKISAEALSNLIAIGGFPPNARMTGIEVNPIITVDYGPRI